MKKILNFLKFSKRNTAKIIFSGISYYFLINYNHEKTIFNIETKIQPEINEIKPLEKNIFEISGKINPLIKSLIERLEKINIKIIEKNDEKQEFYGINSDNEKKEFKINDERDFIKVLNFYNNIEIIENEEKFFEKIESLKDNEKIIIGFMKNEDKKAFKEIKYDFIDNNSMFYLINECNLMNKFNFELNSIICIKKNEECFNYLHNDKKFQLEKFELNEKISKNLYKKCLESINYVNIDQEIINLLNICNELKMNKFLICSFLKNSDDLTKEKYKKKLKKISDENKDILFILTENQTILKNYVKILQ